jgi:signal transduction histidine kinase
MDPSTPGDASAGAATAAAERSAWPAALARLAGGLSHEARNPLHAVALQVALLEEKLEGPAAGVAAPHLAALRVQVDRIDELLRSVAALADPGEGPMVDMAELARLAIRMHGPAMRPGRVRAELTVGEGARPVADREGRAAGLLVLLLGAALAEVAEEGLLALTVSGRPSRTELLLAYPPRLGQVGTPAGLDTAAGLATDLGGRLARHVGAGRIVLTVELPEGGPA